VLLLKLAFRNIFRQRRRSLLTALSMSGGYILCALSISLTNGSFKNAVDIFTLDHTGHIQIHKENYLHRPKVHKTIDDPENLSRTLDAEDEITSHTLRVFAPALSYSDTGNTPVQVIGVDIERERTTSRLEQKISKGHYFDSKPDANGYYKAMIGAGVAETLKTGPGDELVLISQGADGSVANDIYIVNAVVGTRISPDRTTVFLPLVAAQQFLSMPGRVHEVALLVKNDSKNQQTATLLQKKLPELTVSPWQVVEESFFKSMQTKMRSNQFTLGIVIFIVFIGVLNTVVMSVMERTREFGVLKAIGSKPVSIVSLITLETCILSLLSVALGFILSLPLIAWFAFVGIELAEPRDLGGIPISFMTGEMSTFVFVAPMVLILIFALIVSIPPGIRAARISPTAAMGSH